MFDKLREILFNLISLTNARHIRGKAKYNAIGRLINEIEDICMYTDWKDKTKVVSILEQAAEAMKSGGYRLSNAQSLVELNLDGSTYNKKSEHFQSIKPE